LAECCRVKCRAGDSGSCNRYFLVAPVAQATFWNWPKVMQLPWKERLGVTAPPELVEYLSIDRPSVARAQDDPDLNRDLLWAWERLPAAERAEAEQGMVAVSVLRGIREPVQDIIIWKSPKEAVGSVIVLRWEDSLTPLLEWRHKARAVYPAALPAIVETDRRATLRSLLFLGIRQIRRGRLVSE
jgi:hypothetical protein